MLSASPARSMLIALNKFVYRVPCLVACVLSHGNDIVRVHMLRCIGAVVCDMGLQTGRLSDHDELLCWPCRPYAPPGSCKALYLWAFMSMAADKIPCSFAELCALGPAFAPLAEVLTWDDGVNLVRLTEDGFLLRTEQDGKWLYGPLTEQGHALANTMPRKGAFARDQLACDLAEPERSWASAILIVMAELPVGYWLPLHSLKQRIVDRFMNAANAGSGTSVQAGSSDSEEPAQCLHLARLLRLMASAHGIDRYAMVKVRNSFNT